MKILVADDDALSRSLMRRMLLQSGYEVVTAKDGKEAAAIMLEEDGPRLALLDWMMPELDGPDVCQVIRSSSRRAYVYMTLLTSQRLQGRSRRRPRSGSRRLPHQALQHRRATGPPAHRRAHSRA